MAKNTTGLVPFKKGDDPRRNTAGRPKLPDLTEVLTKVLADAPPGSGKSALEDILKEVTRRAKKGNMKAVEILLERAYGKPKGDGLLENLPVEGVTVTIKPGRKRPKDAK